MKSLLLALSVLMAVTSAQAANRIESWKSGKETLKFVERDADGLFKRWGTLKVEHWNDRDDRSDWVARKADGTFVTGYVGHIEKMKIGKGGQEHSCLVIRDARGEFVTWEDLEKDVTAGWENDRTNGWRYVVRYKGQFLNLGKAKYENWNGYKYDVLVVRDTEDSRNNGKILTWIGGEKSPRDGRVYYKDPASGKFISIRAN
jgi:hypothetical protein